MDAPPSAPPVVVVIVTQNPGWWFEECLEALSVQDYPNLSVLVIDAASTDDPTARVAAVLPSAYVRRLTDAVTFAAAANEVIGVVEGASHFLFCHDDVAPAPDAVRLLVEEAFRSNAGVVAPKVVRWDEPDRLLAVGASADKGGVIVPFVEPGELDQEQHDAVRDVFLAPSAALLVRGDLFTTLGGFDPVMGAAGADLDLCWRAQIAGARVVVAPAAVVRHVEAPGDAPGVSDDARLRAVFKNYGPTHLLRVGPQLFLLSLGEALANAVRRRPEKARAVLRPWVSVLSPASLRDLRRTRRATRRTRAVPDRELRQLQAPGNARLRHAFRAAWRREAVQAEARELAQSWRQGLRLAVAVWLVVAVVLLFGTRHLLARALPLYGELVPLVSPTTLARHALSGWRVTGMGSASVPPPAFALLAAGAALVLGHVAFLQRLIVLGLVPLGVWGASRLGRSLGSWRARLAAAVLYAVNPLPYDALARGRWSGLVMYAAVPWLLIWLLAATGLEPFAPPDASLLRRRSWAAWRPFIGLGLVLAVAGAFVPVMVAVPTAIALGLLVGCVLVGGQSNLGRAVRLALGAGAVAAVLLFPWDLGFLGRGAPLLRVATPTAGGPTVAQLLRFQTGPIGASPLGWGLLATAALPLVVGREWRFEWAVRLWALALASWALAWISGRGWVPVPMPTTEVILAPGMAALATCAGLGLTAFELDLRGYHFGWRQVVSTVAALAAGLAVLPTLGAAADGGWHAPGQGFETTLSWMADRRADGDFRVLWLGDPAVLPIAGWRLGAGVAYATSWNGPPDVTTSWPGPAGGPTGQLARVVRLARRDQTTALGHLLAPMAVRYIVVVQRAAPLSSKAASRPAPADLVTALASQIDLRPIDSDPSLLIYENAAWVPARAVLPADAVDASRSADVTAAADVDLSGGPPVLPTDRGQVGASGVVQNGAVVMVAASPDRGWHLRVDGAPQARSKAFGVANAFTITNAGSATLGYDTKWPVRLALALQVLLWTAAVVMLVQTRGRREAPSPVDNAQPDEPSAREPAPALPVRS